MSDRGQQGRGASLRAAHPCRESGERRPPCPWHAMSVQPRWPDRDIAPAFQTPSIPDDASAKPTCGDLAPQDPWLGSVARLSLAGPGRMTSAGAVGALVAVGRITLLLPAQPAQSCSPSHVVLLLFLLLCHACARAGGCERQRAGVGQGRVLARGWGSCRRGMSALEPACQGGTAARKDSALAFSEKDFLSLTPAEGSLAVAWAGGPGPGRHAPDPDERQTKGLNSIIPHPSHPHSDQTPGAMAK